MTHYTINGKVVAIIKTAECTATGKSTTIQRADDQIIEVLGSTQQEEVK